MSPALLILVALAAVALFVGLTSRACRNNAVGDAALGIDVDDVGLDILSTQDGGPWSAAPTPGGHR